MEEQVALQMKAITVKTPQFPLDTCLTLSPVLKVYVSICLWAPLGQFMPRSPHMAVRASGYIGLSFHRWSERS